MKRRDAKKKSIARPSHRGSRARVGGQTLRTCTIGVLPIVNQLLDRMQLESFFKQHLPRDGRRMVVPTSRCLLLLLRNILLSREPIYGLGEWAERFVPELLGLKKGDLDWQCTKYLDHSQQRRSKTWPSDWLLNYLKATRGSTFFGSAINRCLRQQLWDHVAGWSRCPQLHSERGAGGRASAGVAGNGGSSLRYSVTHVRARRQH